MLIRSLPRESATARSVFGDKVAWGDSEYLMALVVDAVQVGNWQRQGRPHASRPPAIPRPGADRIGTKSLTVEEYRARRRARELGKGVGDRGR